LFAQADAYKAADFAISTNGGTVSTSSVGAVPVVNRMVIGASVGGGAPVNGTIKRLTFWPTRLANTTIQQITQP
jgi:quinol-cytochrome oxidoreductase complex cytochrome b subunit